MRTLCLLTCFGLLVGCGNPTADAVVPGSAPELVNTAPAAPPAATPAELLLQRAVRAHGGDRYDAACYTFTFRKKQYRFRNDGPRYTYTRTEEKDGHVTVDVLDNAGVRRTVDGEEVALTGKQTAAVSGGVNSVIYFATLPHKLQDPAVNLALGGAELLNGTAYEILDVTFDEAGGGTDHDDNFRYWINAETGRIDYLAYDYRVNGGGVRFRAAYNPRMVDGILFQDYVNYKAPVGTKLALLGKRFAAGQLEELSRIETESPVRCR